MFRNLGFDAQSCSEGPFEEPGSKRIARWADQPRSLACNSRVGKRRGAVP
jgi:hypothetical protein